MTTRTERTRALHEAPQWMMQIVALKTKAERLELFRKAVRHYPCPTELNAIAEKAPEWLEVRE